MDLSLCFTLFIIGLPVLCLAENITVYSGQIGETLAIVCPYQRHTSRWRRKSWCKEDDVGFCQNVVRAHRIPLLGWKTKSNTAISDKTSQGLVLINITNIQEDDAGVYQCRTDVYGGDIDTIQRIRIQVLEDNQSEMEKIQYSISGSHSNSSLFWMLVILGGSLLTCKVLVMGLIYSWWKNQESKIARHESFLVSSAETLLFPEESYKEQLTASNSEEVNSNSYYMNYVYSGHLNRVHWEQ
ncbi:triggering receptor expressed on myeloid cells 2-like [Hyperolius riggenbachi]|uniref:triggering receptor expressed on myeloid cells 2-like n=1 Tax=Hyperolius riggenbachi TaxID=752182 RepID=UPI0035A31104